MWLAGRYAVVTYDQRGLSRSILTERLGITQLGAATARASTSPRCRSASGSERMRVAAASVNRSICSSHRARRSSSAPQPSTIALPSESLSRLDKATGFALGFPGDFIAQASPWAFGAALVDPS
ncbi:hypothetical protein [Actinomadura oligospora]|uniref:hypothetical protein n=1 Tax=Actinomadura oligospora TaxID=111804 RepID=UPI00047BD252|nr:hypothetical protein [Actinomadura oligospora]